MRTMRLVVLSGLVLKACVLGVWWWDVAGPAYASKSGGEPVGEAPTERAAPAAAPVSPEVLARSRGFRDLLEAVQKRGAELEHREQTIAAREAALHALEQTVADEVTRLERLARPGAPVPASGTAAASGAAPEPVGAAPAITKIYESMKAEEAAPILDRLDDTTATAILGRMKAKQIAAILASMTRERAVALTKLLTTP